MHCYSSAIHLKDINITVHVMFEISAKTIYMKELIALISNITQFIQTYWHFAKEKNVL
jgi:hypothetical protein